MKIKFIIHVLILLLLGIILSFQQSCKREVDPQDIQKEKEKEIITTVNSFLPEELVQSLEAEMTERNKNSDYENYLDTLNYSINLLKTAIETTFTLEEFHQACDDFKVNLSNLKSTQSLECDLIQLGLGYGKGASVEVGASGTLGFGLAAALETQGGGGVEVIYDFVNLERQIYTFTLCSMGWQIGPGVGAGIAGNIGFTGFYDWFFGNKYGNLSENKQAGPSMSIEWGLGVSLKALLGLEAGISVGTTKDILESCDGIINAQECVWHNPIESEDIKGISFAIEIGGSAGIGAELIAAIQNEYIGYCHQGFEGTYTNYRQTLYGRKNASYRMAAEILVSGITGISVPNASPIDLVSAAAAVIYGSVNPEDCDLNIIPVVSTNNVTAISQISATCGGNVTAQGSTSVTARGVCWSISQNPTISDAHTFDGTGTGSFVSTISGLDPVTPYYVRAYATNSSGTAYGNQGDFETNGIENNTPTASFEINPLSGSTTTVFSFDASTSSDLEDPLSLLQVRWDWENDGVWDSEYSTSKIASHQYNLEGEYTIKLEVKDNGGLTDSETHQVTITNGGGGIEPCPGVPAVTYEGQVYNTVLIGNQCWLRENLNIGNKINNIQEPSNNGIIEKYCYDNNEANCDTKGGLYKWDEMMNYVTTEGAQGICPDGWHIPTVTEINLLGTFLGGNEIAGIKLKSQTGWPGTENGTNESGFTGLPSGYENGEGTFFGIDYEALYWSSTEFFGEVVYNWQIVGDNDRLEIPMTAKYIGLSIRCVKN